MNRHLYLSAAAVVALGLAASGCSKGQQAGTSNTADATATSNTADTTASSNAADGSGNAMGNVEGSKTVSDVQDATSKAVGAAGAMMPTNAQGFVTAAATGDKFEIAAATMAEKKASSADIKAFAKQMIKDHTKTTTEVKGMITKGEVKADPPTALDQRRQGMVDNLKTSKSGTEFDTRYVEQQIAAHEEMLTLMKGFSEHGDNPALKAFAAKTAPTVQMHLDRAKKLKDAMKAA